MVQFCRFRIRYTLNSRPNETLVAHRVIRDGGDLLALATLQERGPDDLQPCGDEPRGDTLFRGRKVDIRLSGKGNSNSHGAGPVY